MEWLTGGHSVAVIVHDEVLPAAVYKSQVVVPVIFVGDSVVPSMLPVRQRPPSHGRIIQSEAKQSLTLGTQVLTVSSTFLMAK